MRLVRLLPAAAFTCVLLLGAGTGYATADSHVMDLSGLLQAAFETDPDLQRAELAIREEQLDADSGWNLFLPDLSLGASISADTFDDSGDSPWTAAVSAGASLAVSGGVSRELRGRTIALEAALLDRRQAEVALERRVRDQYYSVLLAQERIAISERNLGLADQQLEQVQSLFDRGRASQLDVLEARATAISRRPALLQNQQALVSGLSELKELAGLNPSDDLIVQGEITLPPVDLDAETLLRRVEAGSLDLESRRIEIDRLENAALRTARDTYAPRLSASYSYAPRITPPTDGSVWAGEDTWRTGTMVLSVTVPLDPLIPGSQPANAVEASALAIDRALISQTEAVAETRKRVVEIVETLELSALKIAALEEALAVASARYDQTVVVFESGGAELLAVEDALGVLERSQLDLLQERYAVVSSLIELDALAGSTILE